MTDPITSVWRWLSDRVPWRRAGQVKDDLASQFGPAQGGYGPASSPDAAQGGKGTFGPDATHDEDDVGESALDPERDENAPK